MAKPIAEPRDQKCFSPSPRLIQYMSRRLQLSTTMEDLDAAGKEFSTEINTKDRSLRTQKTRILDDIIFPAMANLTYFFQFIAKHPELQVLFENDIKDLLGVRRNKPQDQIYAFMFYNLIWDILASEKRDDNKNFRVELNNRLQKIVLDKTKQCSKNVFKTEEIRKSVSDDFYRVLALTELVAYGVDKDEGSPNRTFDFHIDKP